ncbi:MAG: nucleotide exchange factor GrpE [Gammaproteobacteria bacterium]|nr:nucleotide exchange factor GrpE [Gammaproteobacteria bacterium]
MSDDKNRVDGSTPQAEEAAEAPAAMAGGEELQLQLEDARAKADQHWDQLLRTQAELENTRRRAERDVENAHKYGLERFAQELLPVRDSLELGLAAAQGTDSVAKLQEGMELILKMLTAAMEKYGIKLVDPVGQPFDPALHQAVTMQPSEQPANTVLAVMQKGYTLNDRLIRPAMVIVARAPDGEPGQNVDAKA